MIIYFQKLRHEPLSKVIAGMILQPARSASNCSRTSVREYMLRYQTKLRVD